MGISNYPLVLRSTRELYHQLGLVPKWVHGIGMSSLVANMQFWFAIQFKGIVAWSCGLNLANREAKEEDETDLKWRWVRKDFTVVWISITNADMRSFSEGSGVRTKVHTMEICSEEVGEKCRILSMGVWMGLHYSLACPASHAILWCILCL